MDILSEQKWLDLVEDWHECRSFRPLEIGKAQHLRDTLLADRRSLLTRIETLEAQRQMLLEACETSVQYVEWDHGEHLATFCHNYPDHLCTLAYNRCRAAIAAAREGG